MESPIQAESGRWSALCTTRRIFLPLAWIFGSLFVFLTPPFQVPDEYMHFYRAYQVSEGRFTAFRHGADIGGYLPTSLVDLGKQVSQGLPLHPEIKQNLATLWDMRRIPLHPDVRQFVVFGDVSWHSPTNYLPQAAAIAIGRKLGLNPLWLMYAGRLGNLLIWSLLVYFALRLIPIMDWTLLLLALMPMSLAQASSLSADATVNGVCFLFVAAALRFAVASTSPIKPRALFALTILGAAVALAKTAYLPLTILFLLIPPTRFRDRKRYWVTFAIFMLACLATIVAWSLCTYGAQSHTAPNVSPRLQAIQMLHHPLAALWRDIGMLLAVPYLSSIIARLGWYDTKLALPSILLYAAVLFWTTRIGGWPDVRLSTRQRVVLAAAACGCWLAVFTLIYLTFTPVGGRSINGLQGRYLIPATLPFFLLFYPAPRPRHANPGPIIAPFSAAFSLYALLVLVCRFYIW